MPIYEYKCSGCGEVTEWLMSITQDIKKMECDKCNCEANRMISTSTFKINGFSEANGYSTPE
jgi:putative FmdB family regulatory protein